MFKEKLYNGTLTTYTGTTSIRRYPSTNTISVNIYKTDLFNNCLVDFLTNECGLSSDDVKYYAIENSSDDRKGSICIFGMYMQFYFMSNDVHYRIANSSRILFERYTSSSTAQNSEYMANVVFQNGDYNFKLCLIGNPNCGFNLWISNYWLYYIVSGYSSSSIYYRLNWSIYRLRDIVNKKSYTMLACINYGLSYTYDETGNVVIDGVTQSEHISKSSYYELTTTYMSKFPNKYPLIPVLMWGFYEVLNGYYLVSREALGITSAAAYTYSSPRAAYFYQIGNDTFCLTSAAYGALIKL